MKNVEQWLRMKPLDTLFFKGSEPMVAGQDHEVSTIFPPMPSTIMGALRAAILAQKGVNVKDFIKDGGPASEIMDRLPLLGTPEEPGFKIAGPFFEIHKNGFRQIFWPAPAHWFANIKNARAGKSLEIRAGEFVPNLIEDTGLCGSTPAPVLVLDPHGSELKSLGGFWVNQASFSSMATGRASLRFVENPEDWARAASAGESERPVMASLSAFFTIEPRVGIALGKDRKVESGHFYTSTHVRMYDGVSMIVGLSRKMAPQYLERKGLMQLGGEMRMVRYQVVEREVQVPSGQSGWKLALSPFPIDELKWKTAARVSGPLIRLAGWDMKKKFHKPVTAYLPAGTVVQAGRDENEFGFATI